MPQVLANTSVSTWHKADAQGTFEPFSLSDPAYLPVAMMVKEQDTQDASWFPKLRRQTGTDKTWEKKWQSPRHQKILSLGTGSDKLSAHSMKGDRTGEYGQLILG